jgi:hypothetical protein
MLVTFGFVHNTRTE